MDSGLAEKIRIMNFNEVSKVVRDSLALDKDVRVTPDSNLVNLGAEPIDVLDMFYKLKIPDMKYISGEKINKEGKRRLWDIFNAKKERDWLTPDLIHWWKLSSYDTTSGFINQLLVKDLLEIQAYEATH